MQKLYEITGRKIFDKSGKEYYPDNKCYIERTAAVDAIYLNKQKEKEPSSSVRDYRVEPLPEGITEQEISAENTESIERNDLWNHAHHADELPAPIVVDREHGSVDFTLNTVFSDPVKQYIKKNKIYKTICALNTELCETMGLNEQIMQKNGRLFIEVSLYYDDTKEIYSNLPKPHNHANEGMLSASISSGAGMRIFRSPVELEDQKKYIQALKRLPLKNDRFSLLQVGKQVGKCESGCSFRSCQ